MMNSFKKTFWSSLHKKKKLDNDDDLQKPTSRFGFFSNPSTPRSETRPDSVNWATKTMSPSSLPTSPNLHCKTSSNKSPLSYPSTPSSPNFSLLKSKLCFTKSSNNNKCGICLQSTKPGKGTTIFTAECSHTFHFQCISSISGDRNLYSGDRNILCNCPVCGSSWRETSLLASPKIQESKKNKALRVYNDDESLITSPIFSPSRFNTILESNEEEEEDNGNDFKGFPSPLNLTDSVNGDFKGFPSPLNLTESVNGHVEVKLSSESAIVAVTRGFVTYTVVVKVKSPPLTTEIRSPVDLVTVLDVTGGKIESVKKSMKILISLLRDSDRLSIVTFSSSSKRLTPLRRMTANGRRLARRIVDEIVAVNDGEGITVNDAVKKAVKVIEDRRQKNLFTTIFVLTDKAHDKAQWAEFEIPTHTVWFNREEAFAKRVKSLLSLSVSDLTLELGLVSGSGQGEISSVYSLFGKPVWLGTGLIRLGDMYGDEEREVLVEFKSPVSVKSRRILTVRSRHVDPTTQDIRDFEDRALLIPRPIAVRSSNTSIGRLRNVHVSTRTVAESRRLVEAGDYSGAERMLTSARALLLQYGDACLRGLDAELADLNRLRGRHVAVKSLELVAQKSEPLTPTSAWRAAERLAKVAIMRKHMNRVSDLHGFENARF
ncbi:hypothetical protein AALP_AA7G258700 [Arabis alpina]|uniref:RING-type domain-containing protein n=1 Tax=Arabis alpina TaxID=50452 RepID=A0A087GKL8_ARAAL|nr:hypothetical protein AALP_AA7G258700 [Arabis alpina]